MDSLEYLKKRAIGNALNGWHVVKDQTAGLHQPDAAVL
jgi:hypothetical protein